MIWFGIAITLFDVCYWQWYQHKVARQISDLKRELLEELEAAKVSRQDVDQQLIDTLHKFRAGARSDIEAMSILVEDFREMTAPYMVTGDGTEN